MNGIDQELLDVTLECSLYPSNSSFAPITSNSLLSTVSFLTTYFEEWINIGNSELLQFSERRKRSVLVGVVDCTAFACYSVVQGEAVHGEVVCVASPVLEDNPAAKLTNK